MSEKVNDRIVWLWCVGTGLYDVLHKKQNSGYYHQKIVVKHKDKPRNIS